MHLRKPRFEKLSAIILIIIALTVCSAKDARPDSVSIKGSMKIHRLGGYVILINYETRDKWTDNLFFKVQCQFNEGDFIFASSSLNNIERGWHKVEIAIADVIKKRYGSLREYKIDLYKDGMLVDSKTSY